MVGPMYLSSPLLTRYEERQRLLGTNSGGMAMIIDPQGFILANDYVERGANNNWLAPSDGTCFPAKVIGTDPKTHMG